MEGASPVAKALLAGAQAPEVLRRLRHHVRPELHDDPTELLAAGAHVEIDLPSEGFFFVYMGN